MSAEFEGVIANAVTLPQSGNRTVLYAQHTESNGKIVDFGGWDMPIHYGSQLDEHHVVRRQAGMFDVSHMTVVDVQGGEAKAYCQKLFANDVEKLALNQALYSGMLNEEGGVIDDLIVYRVQGGYRVVVNCGTRHKDLCWMAKQSQGFDVTLTEQPDLAMIAIQGPQARELAVGVIGDSALLELKTFFAAQSGDKFVARTGYTGEDGFEIILPNDQAAQFWCQLVEAGVQPCGLGARDTLRLEAGMNLYGHEMDDSVSPLSANMGWTVAWEPADRQFNGRAALEQAKSAGVTDKLVGLVLETKGVLRADQVVETAAGNGVITSGTFSPTLEMGIAMARVPKAAQGTCEVVVRNRKLPAKIVKMPFVRQGKSCLA